jgi:predicted dehydrogenase
MMKVRAGVVGCGAISPAYLRNMQTHFASVLDVLACADLVPDLAVKRATEFGVRRACSTDDLLADPEIELVVNLTPFPAHYDVSMRILKAGKHLFTEKSLAETREQGLDILRTARSKGLLVGAAADTFLSAGPQACLRAINDGEIGKPIVANGFIGMAGHSERYLTMYGGALFDMAPYYLTALVALLGPAVRVSGSAQKPFKELKDAGEGGKSFRVDRPTTVAGILDFAGGCVAVFTASGDVSRYHPRVEIHGDKASLFMGDANGYTAPSRMRKKDRSECELPMGDGFAAEGRGLGVAEMAVALRAGRAPRASGDLAYHVLDIMHAMQDASQQNRHVRLESTCERPAPFNAAELSGE